MDSKNQDRSITLSDIINVIWKNIILVFVVTFLISGMGLIYTLKIVDPTYAASAKVITAVENSTNNNSVDTTNTLRITETIADLAETRAVLEPVAIRMGAKDEETINSYVKYLQSATTETYSTTNYMVGFTVVTDSKEKSVEYVNYITESLVDYVNTTEQIKAFKVTLSIVDPAVFGSYNSPNKTLYIIVSVLAGLVISLVVVFIKEFMSSKFKTKEEIQYASKLAIIGSFIDNKKREKNEESLLKPSIRNFEPYNNLFTNIRYSNVDNPCKVIEFTSTIENELKSTVSTNLAYSIKSNNKSVIVLDFDLRMPSIHTIFKVPRGNGIVEYSSGDLLLEDVIKHTESGVDVITAGADIVNPYVIFESKKISELINELKKRYDYVIIDTPPLAVCGDAAMISKLADGVIYNVTVDQVKKKMFNEGIERLNEVNANIIGLCVTKIKINHANKSSYYYTSKYYQDADIQKAEALE